MDETVNHIENEITTEVIDKPVENETNSTITMSETDLNKKIQSASSKAKNEILKELGINSVKDFQDLKNSYETAVNSKNALEESINSLTKEKNKLNEELMLTKLGVSDEYKEDLLTLAKSKVDENNSLEDVSKSLLEKFPQFKAVKEPVRIGTEKASIKEDFPVDEELSRKYPWLKKR